MSILAVSAFLAVSSPTMAQTSSDNRGTTATSNDDDDDSEKWRLLGLAGLLDLLGLKRRDDDRHRNTSVNR
uniref:Uncharacterized protein n=1 Tax=uncultured Segetibacter sp. TaxID=481133 RepID=A0A6J4TT79_9BACT|nr:MAG: hypothetical protein AVDCRST_MAG96-3548 [uncultured Segetibacter sp.]